VEFENKKCQRNSENGNANNERNMHFMLSVFRKSKPAIAKANTNSFRYSSENRQFKP